MPHPPSPPVNVVAAPGSSPGEVGLHEDADQMAPHNATLIAEEDIRERVTIPAEFIAKHLWSPFSSPFDPSPPALTTHLKGRINFPPAVLAQARAALSNALFPSSQLYSVPSQPAPTPVPQPASGSDSNKGDWGYEEPQSPHVPNLERPCEPVVTLLCPFDHTAGVIDGLVHTVALSEQAEVLVLDALMFAQSNDLGPGSDKFLNTLFGIGGQDDLSKQSKAQMFLRAMINVELPTSSADEMIVDAEPSKDSATDVGIRNGGNTDDSRAERPQCPTSSFRRNSPDAVDELPGRPRARIIYLKDFGAIASHGRSFLRELIVAVRSRRTALQTNLEPHCKIKPTVIVLGVSHSPEHSLPRWSAFINGFKSPDYENLCLLCPNISQPSASSDTESIANVLGDALLATPNRVRDANTTSDDPDMGHGAIYRRVIGMHGFFDLRDLSVVQDGSGGGGHGSDLGLWLRGEAVVQKERKEEFASLRAARVFAANEELLHKALASCGGKACGGFGVFSALPEGTPTADDTTRSNKLRKTGEELEMEKFATLSGLRSNKLPQALANSIAALALYGLSPKSATSESVVSETLSGNSMPSFPSSLSTEIERIVSPGDVATAVVASISGKHQLEQWLDNYEKLKKGNECDVKRENNEDPKEDPVVAKVRASGSLNEYEERLFGCVVDTTQLDTRFEDVCIEPKIIESVQTMISLPLTYPAAFATGILHKEALSGILLYGPPGTGKTMLCRAIAKECKIRMLLITPSDVEDMYVGETEKLVTATFSLARKIAPCAIFIDEVDALFGLRTGNSSRYHRSTLTQFMQEMDGLKSAVANKKSGIVVIGATNRPFDLDDAILRRLPRRMLVDLPGPKEREAILKVHLTGEIMEGIDLAELARRANNYSGSDLKSLAVCAALASLKDIVPATRDTKRRRTARDASATDINMEEDSADHVGIQDNAGPEDEEDANNQQEDKFELPPRVIRDMESVRQLRSWAAKFSRNSSARCGVESANTAATPTNGYAPSGFHNGNRPGSWNSSARFDVESANTGTTPANSYVPPTTTTPTNGYVPPNYRNGNPTGSRHTFTPAGSYTPPNYRKGNPSGPNPVVGTNTQYRSNQEMSDVDTSLWGVPASGGGSGSNT